MRTLIIEDEEAAVRVLKRLLGGSAVFVEIEGVVGSVRSAVSWLRSHPAPDLILMDIELADGLSFQIAEEVEISSVVIFVTAYDEYAIKAFELNSVDYLLKPVQKAQLDKALKKAQLRMNQPVDGKMLAMLSDALTRRPEVSSASRFLGRLGRKLFSIAGEEVAYFHRDDEVYMCCRDGRQFVMSLSLDKLESRVDQTQFFRLNRQYLVNLDAIRTVRTLKKSKLEVELDPDPGESPVVSQERSADLKSWLGD